MTVHEAANTCASCNTVFLTRLFLWHAGCSTQLKAYDQCGGTTNCVGARCGDKVSQQVSIVPASRTPALQQHQHSMPCAVAHQHCIPDAARTHLTHLPLRITADPAAAAAVAAVPTVLLQIFQAWDGHCCPANSLCVRGNAFYYQCLPKPGVNAAPATAAARTSPRAAAPNAAPVGNPPRNAVVAAPPQEPVIPKMKGGK